MGGVSSLKLAYNGSLVLEGLALTLKCLDKGTWALSWVLVWIFYVILIHYWVEYSEWVASIQNEEEKTGISALHVFIPYLFSPKILVTGKTREWVFSAVGLPLGLPLSAQACFVFKVVSNGCTTPVFLSLCLLLLQTFLLLLSLSLVLEKILTLHNQEQETGISALHVLLPSTFSNELWLPLGWHREVLYLLIMFSCVIFVCLIIASASYIVHSSLASPLLWVFSVIAQLFCKEKD